FATERHADDRPCRIRAVLDAAWPESVFKTPAAVGSRRMDRDDGLSAIELFHHRSERPVAQPHIVVAGEETDAVGFQGVVRVRDLLERRVDIWKGQRREQ